MGDARKRIVAAAAIAMASCRHDGCGDTTPDAGTADGSTAEVEVPFETLYAHPERYAQQRIRLRGYALFGVVHRWVYSEPVTATSPLRYFAVGLSPEAEAWLQPLQPIEGDIVVVGVVSPPPHGHGLHDVDIVWFQRREPRLHYKLIKPDE